MQSTCTANHHHQRNGNRCDRMSVIDKTQDGSVSAAAILPGLQRLPRQHRAPALPSCRASASIPPRQCRWQKYHQTSHMRSGVMFGNAAMIDGMLDRIEEEGCREKTSIIAYLAWRLQDRHNAACSARLRSLSLMARC
ncbi:MAG: hypothetical protein ACLT76_01220 [Clostridium fessum]